MDSSDTKSLDCIEFRDDDFYFPYFESLTQDCFQIKPNYELEEEVKRSCEDSEEDAKSLHESVNKLLKPSKKISKRQKKVKAITRQNAEKLAPFFEQWKQLRKKNKGLKKQIKFWFASYNMKLNKTYIYRDFFDSIRIHFRLAIRENNSLNLAKLEEAGWQKVFVNLTNYLMTEINKASDVIMKGKKSQVYPVWIEDVDTFKIEKIPTNNDSFQQFIEFWKQ